MPCWASWSSCCSTASSSERNVGAAAPAVQASTARLGFRLYILALKNVAGLRLRRTAEGGCPYTNIAMAYASAAAASVAKKFTAWLLIQPRRRSEEHTSELQ